MPECGGPIVSDSSEDVFRGDRKIVRKLLKNMGFVCMIIILISYLFSLFINIQGGVDLWKCFFELREWTYKIKFEQYGLQI